MNNNFTIDDLKIGYVVRFSDNILGIIQPISELNNIIILKNHMNSDSPIIYYGWLPISAFNKDLTSKTNDLPDIIEVYGYAEIFGDALNISTNNRKLLYKKEEERKNITIKEIEKELGYKINIIEE